MSEKSTHGHPNVTATIEFGGSRFSHSSLKSSTSSNGKVIPGKYSLSGFMCMEICFASPHFSMAKNASSFVGK